MSLMFEALGLLFTAQVSQANLTGRVQGEVTGEPLAGAIVALPDLGRAATTDGSGRYVLHGVPAGPQHITIRFIGHTQATLHALVPSSGQLEINVFLRAEVVRLHTLEVRSSIPLRGLEGGGESGLADRSSSIAAVRNNPMLAEPDVLQALAGGSVVLQPESPHGVHIRGGSSDQTSYLLDGIPVLSPYHAAGQFSAWNPDALASVHLFSSAPLPGYPGALSGTISATTKAPGEHFGVQGSLTTTQAGLTMDGQIGSKGPGYLLSVRSRVPGISGGRPEPSYLEAESADVLGKLELPAGDGQLRFLGYTSGNEIEAAAGVDGSRPRSASNMFGWHSRSFGAEWSGGLAGAGVKLTAWSANGDAAAGWAGAAGSTRLTYTRHDLGLLGTVELGSGRAQSVAGVLIHRTRTDYRTDEESTAPWGLRATTPSAAVFVQHTRDLSGQVSLMVNGSLEATPAGLHSAPSAQIRWRPSARLTLSGSYARVRQFSQSLRNPQSVVGNVFPVDLFIASGAPGVPAARIDLAVLQAELVPFGGGRVALEAYTTATNGLLLVAPASGGPFATGAFETGSGRSAGFSMEAAVSSAHFGVATSYGLQRTRLRYGVSRYVPDHGTTHLLQAGLIVFPTATTSVRLGATGAGGRRTTPVTGGLEWEACNLLDQGCEFAGSPEYGAGSIGSAGLPAYFRVDLGVRKHWHFRLGGRDAMMGLFATVTNLLNRKNILTYSDNPATGERSPIEMRPLAPLVAGLDWSF